MTVCEVGYVAGCLESDDGGQDQHRQNETQKPPQPAQEKAEVVPGAAEDGIDPIAVASFEEVPSQQSIVLHMTDDRLDGASAPQLPSDGGGRRFVAGAPDLEALEAVSLIPLVDVNALNGDAGPFLRRRHRGLQGVTVVGIAVQGVDVNDKLTGWAASVGGGQAHLAAELLRLGGLALADALDLGRMQGINLRPGIAAQLGHDPFGQP
jgi:hypothetical protein